MEIRWKGGLSCLVKRSRLKRLGRQTFVVVAVVGVGIGRGSRLVQAPGPEGRERGKDPRSTAGIQCREGVEMDSESGVVEVGRSPRGRKWARVTGPREGGEGGRKKRGSGGRSPDGENIHTSIHVRCVAWLCRCVLDLVAANAAHLLCPWWIFCRCLVPCSEWAGLPLAKDRPPMDRHAQAHSQGTLGGTPYGAARQLPAARHTPPGHTGHAHQLHKGMLRANPERQALAYPTKSVTGPMPDSPDNQGTVGGVTCGQFSNFHALGARLCPWVPSLPPPGGRFVWSPRMDGIFQLFLPDLRSFAFHAVKQNPLAGSVVSLSPDHQHRRDLGGASKYVYLGFGAPTPSPRTRPQNPALHGAVRSHCSAFVAAAPEGMEDGSMARSGQCVHRNSTPIPAVQPTRLLLLFHAVAGRSHTLPKLRSWAGSSCPAGGGWAAGLPRCVGWVTSAPSATQQRRRHSIHPS